MTASPAPPRPRHPARRAARRLGALLRREDGAMLVLALYLLIVMLLCVGFGVDVMRTEYQRTRLQSTLDRAVLAAADLDQTRPAETVVEDYVARAGLADDLTQVTSASGLNFSEVHSAARMRVPSLFLKLAGISSFPAVSASTAREEVPNVEISLVLDISGSMRFDDRIGDLEPAAKEFVTTVLNNDAATTTSINLVPYAGQTNPGPLLFDYLGGRRLGAAGAPGDAFPEWPHDISDIVTYFDTDGDGTIDAAASVAGFPASTSDDHLGNDLDAFYTDIRDFAVASVDGIPAAAEVIGVSIAGGGAAPRYFRVADNANGPAPDAGPTLNGAPLDAYETAGELSWEDFGGPPAEVLPNVSSCLELGGDDFTHSGLPAAGSYLQTPHFMYYSIAASVMDWGWCPEDDTAIRYASNDEAALRDFIGDIRMHDGTGTHYAMKYALALLDPSSRGAFGYLADHGAVPGAFRNRPADWSAENSAKYIVLMTDGKITAQYRPTDPLDPENARTALEDRPRSERDRTASESTNVDRFYAACELARRHGVIVYTIAFEVDGQGKREMRDCASSPSNFFDVEGREISEAFSAIASQINHLRLTQ